MKSVVFSSFEIPNREFSDADLKRHHELLKKKKKKPALHHLEKSHEIGHRRRRKAISELINYFEIVCCGRAKRRKANPALFHYFEIDTFRGRTAISKLIRNREINDVTCTMHIVAT